MPMLHQHTPHLTNTSRNRAQSEEDRTPGFPRDFASGPVNAAVGDCPAAKSIARADSCRCSELAKSVSEESRPNGNHPDENRTPGFPQGTKSLGPICARQRRKEPALSAAKGRGGAPLSPSTSVWCLCAFVAGLPAENWEYDFSSGRFVLSRPSRRSRSGRPLPATPTPGPGAGARRGDRAPAAPPGARLLCPPAARPGHAHQPPGLLPPLGGLG